MQPPPPDRLIAFPRDERPRLVVIVDAEEEFQWGDYSSAAISVRTIRDQALAHRIYDRYGVVPVYAVDYPVASQDDGIRPLRELLQDGKCEIGAQLHTWVTPPLEEKVSVFSSFPCNLSRELEFAKLARLTHAIGEAFGVAPRLYRAGRYGFGANTPASLAALGYHIDCSILPHIDLRPRQGPDYRRMGVTPFWFDPRHSLMELPLTVGLVGWLGHHEMGRRLYPMAASAVGERLRLPGMLARARLLDRIPLTPEGTSVKEAKQLTRWLLAHGQRVFCVSYHSPSLAPGYTPYVRDLRDRDRLLAWLDEYMAFFLGEIGGMATTPAEVRERAIALTLAGSPLPAREATRAAEAI